MQVRDGPAAVRGVALPPRRHWCAGYGPGRRREREPRVRRPAARHQLEPLVEGGFVLRRTLSSPLRGGACSSGLAASRPSPARHGRRKAVPHRGSSRSRHCDRDAVRHRRRRAGDRRRRPVGLPEDGAEDQALRLHPERRGDRRLPARPRRHLVSTRRACPARSPKLAHPGRAAAARRRRFGRLRSRCAQLGRATGHIAGGDGARRAHEERGSRQLVKAAPRTAR